MYDSIWSSQFTVWLVCWDPPCKPFSLNKVLAYTDTQSPAESAPLPIQLQLADIQTEPDNDKIQQSLKVLFTNIYDINVTLTNLFNLNSQFNVINSHLWRFNLSGNPFTGITG